MPEALRNGADWRYFQQGLDAADLVVLGRLGHEAHGNPGGRVRMVVSRSVEGLERRADGWWWNPADLPWSDTHEMPVVAHDTPIADLFAQAAQHLSPLIVVDEQQRFLGVIPRVTLLTAVGGRPDDAPDSPHDLTHEPTTEGGLA